MPLSRRRRLLLLLAQQQYSRLAAAIGTDIDSIVLVRAPEAGDPEDPLPVDDVEIAEEHLSSNVVEYLNDACCEL
jgi:hypothetical protein